MKNKNKKVSQKKSKRYFKNLKRISRNQNRGHFLYKFKTEVNLTTEQIVNAEKALADSIVLNQSDLKFIEPWAISEKENKI